MFHVKHEQFPEGHVTCFGIKYLVSSKVNPRLIYFI